MYNVIHTCVMIVAPLSLLIAGSRALSLRSIALVYCVPAPNSPALGLALGLALGAAAVAPASRKRVSSAAPKSTGSKKPKQ